MKWLFYKKESIERAVVALIYHVEPEDKDMYDGCMEVEGLLEPEQKEGKNSILYCNPVTEEYWYEYEDREMSEEEKAAERIEVMQEALDFLLMNGGM